MEAVRQLTARARLLHKVRSGDRGNDGVDEGLRSWISETNGSNSKYVMSIIPIQRKSYSTCTATTCSLGRSSTSPTVGRTQRPLSSSRWKGWQPPSSYWWSASLAQVQRNLDWLLTQLEGVCTPPYGLRARHSR